MVQSPNALVTVLTGTRDSEKSGSPGNSRGFRLSRRGAADNTGARTRGISHWLLGQNPRSLRAHPSLSMHVRAA